MHDGVRTFLFAYILTAIKPEENVYLRVISANLIVTEGSDERKPVILIVSVMTYIITGTTYKEYFNVWCTRKKNHVTIYF